MEDSQTVTSTNYWAGWSEGLVPAYVRHAESILGAVRFELVTRTLLEHLGPGPGRVIDVGGGYGEQAIRLARAGHEVVVVDPDPQMLVAAEHNLAREGDAVRRRIRLIHGPGEHAAELAGSGYDLACCHSVLLYLPDPGPMLASLAGLVRPGGFLSILTLNAEASAMRSGLQGSWPTALAELRGEPAGDHPPVRADTVADITARLASLGMTSVAWRGIRVFTDHLQADPQVTELDDICALEWEASGRDPYRKVARLFHLVVQRAGEGPFARPWSAASSAGPIRD